MRPTFAGITTAFSALQANQRRLDVVGQNLSNMNTPGYTRQQLDVISLNHFRPITHSYANGYEGRVGFGVKIEGVSRIRDPFLDVQYREQIVKSGYNESMQTSLDTLARILDESTISGIRKSFDDIQTVLTNMQDPAKVMDSIYESEFRIRLQNLTNKLNDADRRINSAMEQEYQLLDGTLTSENGSVERINKILEEIGELNQLIKRNNVADQPGNELMDNRDTLLDELASYIPIDVRYELSAQDYAPDMYVDMVYTKPDGTTGRMTLVNGTTKMTNLGSAEGKTYGRLAIEAVGGNYSNTKITFFSGKDSEPAVTAMSALKTSGSLQDGTICFSSGSIQAGLDMLGKTGTGNNNDTVRGYLYYKNELDSLADTIVRRINEINNNSAEYKVQSTGGAGQQPTGAGDLLKGSTAGSIGISAQWANSSIHIGTRQDGSSTHSANETALELLKLFESNSVMNGKNSFSDFVNHISAIQGTDSYYNQAALKTNVSVLNGIQDTRDSISGVSLDEEASNMMSYLNAYNAAARLMTALDEALDVLINKTGL